MNSLDTLLQELRQGGYRFLVDEAGQLRLTGDQPAPRALVQAVRTHKTELLAGLGHGGLRRLLGEWTSGQCGTCVRWQGPDEYGDGLCPLGRLAHGWLDGNPDAPVLCPAGHRCLAYGGLGWWPKAAPLQPGVLRPAASQGRHAP